MKSQREGEEGKRIVTGKILKRLFLAKAKNRLTSHCLSHPLRFACLQATPLLSYSSSSVLSSLLRHFLVGALWPNFPQPAMKEGREREERNLLSETESKDPVDVACRRLMMQFGENGEQKKKAFSFIEEISFLSFGAQSISCSFFLYLAFLGSLPNWLFRV